MERMLSDEEVMEIGRKLKNLREKLGLTQQEFADRLFWDVSSYQKIESGKTLMTLDKAVQLHKDYKVDLNYFAAGDSFDSDEILLQVLVNSSKEESTKSFIRLLEYILRLAKMSLTNENETDTDTGR